VMLHKLTEFPLGSRFSVLILILPFLGASNVLAQTQGGLVPLADNVPAALMSAQYVRHHDPATTLSVTIALKLRNTDELGQFLQNVVNSASSEYQQFLTPTQFADTFGPTAAEVSTVVNYLHSQGLHVGNVSPDNILIHVRDRSGAIESALDVQINDYVYQGRNVYGTPDNPQLPSAIASLVQSVLGLSNIVQLQPMSMQSSVVVPLSGTSPSGYSPLQIATAYDWPSITNTSKGAGVIIANATADSSNLAITDLDTFWNYYGLPTHSVTVINVDGTNGATDGTVETTIDEEWSGAMAPGAALDVYDSASSSFQDFTNTYDRIVTDNTAQIMTTSWGAPESGYGSCTALTADDQIFEEAAAQGIAVFAAAGDHGSSDGTSNPNEADYPSSDSYVVAAGGTTLTLNGDNSRASETAWSGTGGAQSSCFSEPSWQVGPGVPQNGSRNTVDLSMDADPNTGYAVYMGGTWLVSYGGTSFVAPELAGLFAVQASPLGSTRLGQANAAIYADANGSYYSTDFHDIISGSNGLFSAGPGWDHPTGWGTPDASQLIAHITNGQISPPQNLDAEYIQCINQSDNYLVTWSPPAFGTPSGGYDVEYEYTSDGVWHSFSYGPGLETHIHLQAGVGAGIRVRASNGSVWSSYNTDIFTTSPCSPAP
ncbi:MAG: protease pro-enzyme activation domain-containing protein, partial [Gammaproteobacteria bacterium]